MDDPEFLPDLVDADDLRGHATDHLEVVVAQHRETLAWAVCLGTPGGYSVLGIGEARSLAEALTMAADKAHEMAVRDSHA